MMVGVILAVLVFLGLAVVVWYRRSVVVKRREKSVPPEQVQPVRQGTSTSDSDDNFIINRQPSLIILPENYNTKVTKTSVLDETYITVGNQPGPFVNLNDLIREVEAEKVEEEARKGIADGEQSTMIELMNENSVLVGGQQPFPEDPRHWNHEQTARWVYEKFGNFELRGLILSQKINGLALLRLERQHLVTALRLETVGEQLVFEGAVEELRNKSARLAALGEGLPMYE
ncbi:hypothetical protein HDU81_006245 [Chytriomyces hyalinus]|nr:hypothetical protein HDU81_006245 [Chytriomyces hyalinus]